MTRPKQRTTLLAATLAVLVSGGVALQAFAETPIGLRDTQQVEFGASVAGASALAQHLSGGNASPGALGAFDTVEPGRFAGATGVGTLSNVVAAQTAAATSAFDFSSMVSAFEGGNAVQASFSAPIAGNALKAAMRTSAADQAFFANEAGLAPALDLGNMVAAFDRDTAGRLSFAQAANAGASRAALRSEGAASSLFANAAAPAPDLGNMTAVFEAGASRAAFAAQTSGGNLDEAMRADLDDNALFANPVSSLSTPLNLSGLAAAIGGDAASSGAFSAQVADESGPRAAMRSEGSGSGLFAGASASLTTQVDLKALAAALGSDSMEQGAFAVAAGEPTDRLAAMRSDRTGSALFSHEVVLSSPHSVDFARIGAALAADE